MSAFPKRPQKNILSPDILNVCFLVRMLQGLHRSLNLSHMASLQTFLWLTPTADLMPVYPKTADPVEKIPQPTEVPSAALPTAASIPLKGIHGWAAARSPESPAVMNRAPGSLETQLVIL